MPAKKVEDMSSEELTAVSAALTAEKDGYMREYKAKQKTLNIALVKALRAEEKARNSDPEHAKKSQKVG